ncbi:hypothetical protein [Streptomyces sp. NPDC054765]
MPHLTGAAGTAHAPNGATPRGSGVPGARPGPHRPPAAARICETDVRMPGRRDRGRLVRRVPRARLDEALRGDRRSGTGTVHVTVHVTDRRAARTAGAIGGAREALPGCWDTFVSRIGTGVSE